MIIDKDTHPERDCYYLGAVLIDLLSESDTEEVDYLDLYDAFNQQQSISINLYALTLDWLFLLGVISQGEQGRIKKCF